MMRVLRMRAARLVAALLSVALPAALTMVASSAVSCGKDGGDAGHEARYHCPMHPTYVSDRPGDCPICGMRLVPIAAAASAATASAATASGDGVPPHDHAVHAAAPGSAASGTWVCPMEECGVRQDGPGKCPKCGMNLVQEAGAGGVAGHATVETTGEGRRLAGVRTAEAKRERIARTIRAVGSVTVDETRIRHVHTKISGWVNRLYVDFTGQTVRKGSPVLALYSQELEATQQEYLLAREAAARFQGSSLPEVRKGGEDLVQAARRRLELFDVPPGFIARLDRTGKAQRDVPLLAPSSGVVTAKQVFEGQQVTPGMELFTVTDLSRVWIEADLNEGEAGTVRTGDEATLTLAYDPATRLVGRVKYVFPYLDPVTRKQRVRFDVANPKGLLKPGMFVDVRLALAAVDGIVVPDSAVLDSGVRQIVYVAGEGGAFAPREVKVGLRMDGRALIVEGVREGERVAVAAGFLLDSESRLRSALGTPP